jgi:hypothetical protein
MPCRAVTRCRICGGEKLHAFLDLGRMPVPNGFMEKPSDSEPTYPLGAAVCEACWLVQLTDVVPAEVMFSHYLYIPSTSSTMRAHFEGLTVDQIHRWGLGPGDLVVDIGSNDATLLRSFQRQGLTVLGVDPATNLARKASEDGVATLNEPFSSRLSETILASRGRPRLVVSTNTLAHVDDLHDFCRGLTVLLGDEGVFVAEFPYVVDLLENNEFDTIYHEHLSYFALSPLACLFEAHGLRIVDAERIPVHGGSVRVAVVKESSKRVATERASELQRREAPFHARGEYEAFASRSSAIARELVARLEELKAAGKRVVGYGASAKGNVLLNVCGIGTHLVEYIVDSIPYKQGRFTPGTNIPVVPESRLDEDTPDRVLLLAWNFKDEIMEKQRAFRERGGKFIVTVPGVGEIA